jgi:D-3-phosphoglycerate dehydrogenase
MACPLTPETRHMLNADTFTLMKALLAALGERRIAGAMLDVYEHYRLAPGHALLSMDNVILTPHLAAVTRESRARASVAAAEEMLRMLAGERPRNLVNPEVKR